MRKAPYRAADYDEYFEKIIISIRYHIENNDDDYLVLYVGETGTGKSNLILHGITAYTPPELLNINQVALSKEEFADSNHVVGKMPKPRALAFDEANINKRNAMTGWNKDLLDLYYSNRGENVFHQWANPSLEMIDKPFLEDRIKAIVLVTGKGNPHFRYYYWFRKEDVLKIIAEYKTLNVSVLSKAKRKFCYYMGWFKEYKGPLRQAYLDKKADRMSIKSEQFKEKYGSEHNFNLLQFGKIVGVSELSIKKYLDLYLVEGEHYTKTPLGRYSIKPKSVDFLKAKLIEKRMKKEKVKVSA